MVLKITCQNSGIKKRRHKGDRGLNADELRYHSCQPLRVILVHHMPGIVDCDQSLISNGVDPLLFVGAASVVTILAFDE